MSYEKKIINSRLKKVLDYIQGLLFVLARAGSGKTKVVIQKIIPLIQIGADLAEILTLTFINKPQF